MSWTGYSAFLKDPERFIRHYVYGEENIETHAMTFGQEFATLLQERKKHPDPVLDMALKAIPRLPEAEYRMKAVLPSERGPIKLVGSLDGYNPKTHEFIEYKTGVRHWTQGKANRHEQIMFYQLMIYLNHGVWDNKKRLIWVETKYGEDGAISITGDVRAFPVITPTSRLFKFAMDLRKVAFQISDRYQEELSHVL